MRKPFYRASRQCWFVKNHQGKFVRLDKDEKTAHLMWTAMIADSQRSARPRTIFEICSMWLVEHRRQVSDVSYRSHERFAAQFVAHFGEGCLPESLSPGRLIEWLEAPKAGAMLKDGTVKSIKWGAYRKRDAGAAIKRIFRWARNEGYLSRDPVANLRLSSPVSRSVVASVDVHRSLVAGAKRSRKGRPFALYLIASRSGARPQQVRDVTARHVVEINGRLAWQFSKHKTVHHTGQPLVVYLPPCLQTLTRILVHFRPTGNLLLNSFGEPWGKDTVFKRMQRLRKHLKLDPQLVAHSYRHGFITDSLESGLAPATVAAVVGHKSARMVLQVYGHLDQRSEHLAQAVEHVARSAKK